MAIDTSFQPLPIVAPDSSIGESVDADATVGGPAAPYTFARCATALPVVRRVPDADDALRWRRLIVGGRELSFAQPITFTPYAAARACSARCRFCSETLLPRASGRLAATLRPGPHYFEGLARALDALHGLPLSFSLSGLENTDDAPWFLGLLDTLMDSERAGLVVAERVLYSNAAGFAFESGDRLIAALCEFRASWLEVSRHHPHEVLNQQIMRFGDEQPIRCNQVFESVLQRLGQALRIKLVCLVQQGGISDPAGVATYLDWASARGAGAVIFREFSRLDGEYRDNRTARYLATARVDVNQLLDRCMDDGHFVSRLRPLRRTQGYYFNNVVLRDASGMDVVFEGSDYGQMHERHASGRIYKLVYFPNGEMCGGWQPGQDVLLNTSHNG